VFAISLALTSFETAGYLIRSNIVEKMHQNKCLYLISSVAIAATSFWSIGASAESMEEQAAKKASLEVTKRALAKAGEKAVEKGLIGVAPGAGEVAMALQAGGIIAKLAGAGAGDYCKRHIWNFTDDQWKVRFYRERVWTNWTTIQPYNRKASVLEFDYDASWGDMWIEFINVRTGERPEQPKGWKITGKSNAGTAFASAVSQTNFKTHCAYVNHHGATGRIGLNEGYKAGQMGDITLGARLPITGL
jgi:hypothetical protein